MSAIEDCREAVRACIELYLLIHVSELPKYPPCVKDVWVLGQDIYSKRRGLKYD